MNLRGDTYLKVRNTVKDADGYLLADSDTILNRWKNYFPQVLNVHSVNDVMQI
jgi:hypothetical protein